jgi:DNA-binding transcriptional LysR family regulator
MELRHLRYFVTVAEELHFGRAAKRLNMSQPPLSRQIQELEAEIGASLLVRGYHHVELTQAGKVYLAQAKRILEQVETAKHEAAEVALGRVGYLRLGHGTHLPAGYLSGLLAAFHKESPHVAVDLVESPTPLILQALRQKTIDVGFVIAPSITTGLVMKPLFRDRLVIALPEGHRYAAESLTDLAQLAHENFVLCRRYEDPGYRELVEGICRDAGFTPRVLQAVEQKDTVLDLVARGLGVSIVQESTAARATGVRYRPFPRPVTPVVTAVVWREDAHIEAIAPLVILAEREAVAMHRAPAADSRSHATSGGPFRAPVRTR